MTAIASEIDQTLRTLDPQRALALERAFREMLVVARDRPAAAVGKSPVDANGWPIGYWTSVVGALAGEEWEPSPDPPPKPYTEECPQL